MQDFGRYIRIPDAIQWLPSSILKHQAKALWGAIDDRQGENEWAWPSIETLAFEASIARGEVTRYLDQLVELGLIERKATQTSNRYRVKVPALLRQAAASVKAMPSAPGVGFNVQEAKRIFQTATDEWLSSLGHHKTIKLPHAGTPATGKDDAVAGIPAAEMPVSRQAERRKPGIRAAGNPATNLPNASPSSHPRSALAPASPPPAAGGHSQTAPPREQTPEQNGEHSSTAELQSCLPAEESNTAGKELKELIRVLRTGLDCSRRADQWEKLAIAVHADGATPTMVEQACRTSKEARQPLTAATLPRLWQQWAYVPGVLDDADKMLIASSVKRMNRYLNFGREAAICDDDTAFSPTATNWTAAPGYTQDSPNAAAWTVGHFVGYYWFLVCWHRDQFGMQLTFPDFGRLAREIKQYLSTNSKESLHIHFRNLVGHFPVILYMLRNSSVSVALNEGTINNRICQEKIEAYLYMAPEERAAMREAAREAMAA